MNKASIVELIAEKTGYSKKVVTEIVNTNFDLIAESLAQGADRVSISGFGSFRASIVPPKEMVSHLNGGQELSVPETSKVLFNPSEKLKDQVTKAGKAKPQKRSKHS